MLVSKIVAVFAILMPSQFDTLENIYDNFLNSPVTYEEVLNEAIHDCRHRSSDEVPIGLLDQLVEIERKHEVPPKLRGLLLAAACYESGYNSKAEGDHKFDKKGRPKAIGLFQMWPWWTRVEPLGYNIDRTDPIAAAKAFIEHIKRQIPKVKKRCKYRDRVRTWVAAWVHAIRKPKPSGRCYETPRHYRVLKRWHRQIISKRKKAIKAGDGC